MPEPAILHVCPHCGKVFDSPSVCAESGESTVPTPMTVPSQWMLRQTMPPTVVPTTTASALHIGRSWPDAGTPIEDKCPCPQEPCGLIAWDKVDPSCEQHRVTKTIRSSHRAEDCPRHRPTPAKTPKRGSGE